MFSPSGTARSSSRQASSRGNNTFCGLDLSNQSPQKQKRERKLRFADFKGQDDGNGDDGAWSSMDYLEKNPPTKRNNNKKDVEKKAVKSAEDNCKLFAFYIIKITLLSHS